MTRMMKTKTILMVLALSASAFAQPATPPAPRPTETAKLTGDKAKQLMLALKVASIKPVKAKPVWTWTVKKLSCHSADASDDGLLDFDCQVDSKTLRGAPALVLHERMVAAGVPVDEGMSQTHLSVESVSCVDDQSAVGGDAMYVCSFR
jgi:hypothetical protein